MSKDEKGFFDGLVEDFASTMEMKAAIEASRDENGKIDVAKATGISMGLGHMSDNDIAMMGAMLGAEGAFDDDDDTDFDSFDDFDDDVVPSASVPVYTAPNTQTAKPMTEWEYEGKKAGIIAEKKFILIMSVVALCVFTILFFYMMATYPDSAGVYLLLLAVVDASLAYGIHNTTQARERELTTLENQYRESKRVEEENKKAELAHNELKNYAGTQDIATILNQIKRKMKTLFDNADKACGITEPSFDYDMVSGLLSSLLYFAVKGCDHVSAAKATLYDLTLIRTATKSECKGDMLFPVCKANLNVMMQKVIRETFTGLTVASYKSNNPGGAMDFTKTVCSLMILLGEELEKDTSCKRFGESGVSVTLKAAQEAAQRVIDERLLDPVEPSDAKPDQTNDPQETDVADGTDQINMDSIMEKVSDLVSDKSFLSKKLAGREFGITCDACGKAVNIVVTEQLTGVCPLCGHENKLNFSIK